MTTPYRAANKRPWVALLGWFLSLYIIGLIRYWGEPWCTWDGGFIPISCELPAFWWPTKLYQRKTWEKQINRR